MGIPEEWPWEEAKKIFEKPDVTPANEVELEWRNPDIDGLVQFLVNEKGFKYVLRRNVACSSTHHLSRVTVRNVSAKVQKSSRSS